MLFREVSYCYFPPVPAAVSFRHGFHEPENSTLTSAKKLAFGIGHFRYRKFYVYLRRCFASLNNLVQILSDIHKNPIDKLHWSII